MTPGHVYIAGAGPGDPGLVTVATVNALGLADVVIYDALASPALLRYVRHGAELVYAGKRANQHTLKQPEIEALILDHARAGRTVVRLKGGDPFVFGRGGEEALACVASGIPFTVIPGITSAIAAATYAGIPVTHRGLSADFLVLTGNEPGEDSTAIDWEAAARAGTLVILMGAATLAPNMEQLAAHGRAADTPVACVRWGTRPDQLVVTGTLATIADRASAAGMSAPMVTVVGPVAALAEQIGWFRPGLMAGKRVVVTRARAQASALAEKFEALGAEVIEAPVIEAAPRAGDPDLRSAAGTPCNWLVFASANGVDAFFGELAALGRDARALSGRKVAAIGGATAGALLAHGIRADFEPSRATAEALGAELPVSPGQVVLFPCSALTDGRLAAALGGRGALVRQVVAYDNTVRAFDEARAAAVLEADVITFTSASTARNLKEALGERELPAATRLVSIGAQTSASVRECFGRLDAEAASPDLDALVQATLGALA
jgi:uroporphyrinogen III methyltransferase/synthase